MRRQRILSGFAGYDIKIKEGSLTATTLPFDYPLSSYLFSI
jgi:hypothetical protein